MTSIKPLLSVLGGRRALVPPIWLMRQAGRYLPEYRLARTRKASFLDVCFTPDLAAEITLQPIARYGFDAAILFSDILVVPYALGQSVSFREGEGPVLDPIRRIDQLARLDLGAVHDRTAPVLAAARLVAAALPAGVSLIGFAGSPWTVASYMVEGGSSRDFTIAKQWAFSDDGGFARLIEILIEATIAYLDGQIKAGAEIIQLFDSWAGALPPPAFRRWVIEPNRVIVERLKRQHPTVPIIAFPRGAGALFAEFARKIPAAAIGIDTQTPMEWAAATLPENLVLQGNLDPHWLLTGGSGMVDAARAIVKAAGDRPFIFNLGHGILPQTSPDEVARLVQAVRQGA